MKKRLVLALVLVMLLSLVGCGGGGESGQTGDESTDSSTVEDGGQQTEDTSQQDASFSPDDAEGITAAEMREQFGAIPLPTEPLVIGGVAKAFENEFWRTLKEGYEEFGQKLNDQGIDITIDVRSASSEEDEEGQLSIVYDMINKGYDGLMLSPISDSCLTPGVEDAMKENIPVLSVNDGIIPNAEHFVLPFGKEPGQMAADYLGEKLGGEGKVAIVMGMPKAYAARQRTAGFEETMAEKFPNIEIAEKQNADWDRALAKDLAETWINKHDDLDAIFCNNDTMALGVIEAVKESGRDIMVIGVDGTSEAYEKIRAGELTATVDSFPRYMAQFAFEALLRIQAGQELPTVIRTPEVLIDATNCDMDPAELINWTEPVFE